jgi:hypothetical protein
MTLVGIVDGIETVEQQTTCGALAGQVRARVARRPGRWRARMQRPADGEGREPFYPEAA